MWELGDCPVCAEEQDDLLEPPGFPRWCPPLPDLPDHLAGGQITALATRAVGNNGRFERWTTGVGITCDNDFADIQWPNGTRTRSTWPNPSWYWGRPLQVGELPIRGRYDTPSWYDGCAQVDSAAAFQVAHLL